MAPEATRALLIAGRPLGEPIAQYGPFVMNTNDEIFQAVRTSSPAGSGDGVALPRLPNGARASG